MGWWQANKSGARRGNAATGLLWGDIPAGFMGEAVDNIRAAFLAEWRRLPSNDELRAGLEFSLAPAESEAKCTEWPS